MRAITIISFLLLAHSSFSQGKFFGGNGDGFATATLTNVILPTIVLDFTLAEINKEVRITATIKSDIKLDKIILERSSNGREFMPVDSVIAQTIASSQNINIVDRFASEGKNFYRIQVIAQHGSAIMSEIKMIVLNGIGNYIVYSSGTHQLVYQIKKEGQLRLMNSVGQTIFYKKIIAGSGTVSLPAMMNGVYIIRFASDKAKTIRIDR